MTPSSQGTEPATFPERFRLPALRQAGLLVCTTEKPQVVNARYRLPGGWSADDEAAAKRKRAQELLKHPNGQAAWQLLKERGEVTSAEVAASCGFSQGTAKTWLKRLYDLGLGSRDFQGIQGQHGGRQVVYRPTAPECRRNL